MSKSFFDAAAEIVGRSPFHQEAAATRDALIAKVRANHVPAGVAWSAMAPVTPDIPSVAAIAARMETEEAFRTAWRSSPQARIYGAIVAIERSGRLDAAERLRGYYSRSMATMGEPVDPAVIDAVLNILAPIRHDAARDAEAALNELLPAARMAAE